MNYFVNSIDNKISKIFIAKLPDNYCKKYIPEYPNIFSYVIGIHLGSISIGITDINDILNSVLDSEDKIKISKYLYSPRYMAILNGGQCCN